MEIPTSTGAAISRSAVCALRGKEEVEGIGKSRLSGCVFAFHLLQVPKEARPVGID